MKGFTLIELAVVVSLVALVTPLGFLVYRNVEASHVASSSKADAAQSARFVSEELRRDLWTGRLAPGADLVITSAGCGEIRYVVETATLFRKAPTSCGGERAIARNVTSLQREGATAQLLFRWQLDHLRSLEVPFTLGLTGGAP